MPPEAGNGGIQKTECPSPTSSQRGPPSNTFSEIVRRDETRKLFETAAHQVTIRTDKRSERKQTEKKQNVQQTEWRANRLAERRERLAVPGPRRKHGSHSESSTVATPPSRALGRRRRRLLQQIRSRSGTRTRPALARVQGRRSCSVWRGRPCSRKGANSLLLKRSGCHRRPETGGFKRRSAQAPLAPKGGLPVTRSRKSSGAPSNHPDRQT
ncbi:uncharacterized protein LOC105311596 [Pteropus vampyrus]|uniref:Uncharacterized protein LOC105311596 n=1 Tax=Pteropus vampyrus TaxID=132908 RepID=A0A6P3RU39_PTEVA|nr:uncharacterized protein LOC105311596 [Pteropus vampyrus]